jgi:hypothetical protein
MLSADNTDDGGRRLGLKARLCFHTPALQAMSHHAVDITMIDLLRVGGVTASPGCATRSPSGRSVVGEEGLEPSKS